jgi:branched-chain amino acid transport system ATP-binding protein
VSVPIELDGVSKAFGGLQAVRKVSLRIEPGSITGLIGPNGAGKSTLFNLITRVLPVTEGRVTVGDHDATAMTAAQVSGLGVARTFQTPKGFESLSVLENVEAMIKVPRETMWRALFTRGDDREERERALTALDTVGLRHRADDVYGDLSAGEHRLLEIARQIVREPKVLMLDEPTAGVHPDLQDQLRELLLRCRADGMTVVVVEHNLGFLMSIATAVHVLADGELIASGSPQQIAQDPVVRDAYLGRTTEDAP